MEILNKSKLEYCACHLFLMRGHSEPHFSEPRHRPRFPLLEIKRMQWVNCRNIALIVFLLVLHIYRKCCIVFLLSNENVDFSFKIRELTFIVWDSLNIWISNWMSRVGDGVCLNRWGNKIAFIIIYLLILLDGAIWLNYCQTCNTGTQCKRARTKGFKCKESYLSLDKNFVPPSKTCLLLKSQSQSVYFSDRRGR